MESDMDPRYAPTDGKLDLGEASRDFGAGQQHPPSDFTDPIVTRRPTRRTHKVCTNPAHPIRVKMELIVVISTTSRASCTDSR